MIGEGKDPDHDPDQDRDQDALDQELEARHPLQRNARTPQSEDLLN